MPRCSVSGLVQCAERNIASSVRPVATSFMLSDEFHCSPNSGSVCRCLTRKLENFNDEIVLV